MPITNAIGCKNKQGVEEDNSFEYNFGAHVHWLGNTQDQSSDWYFNSQELFWVDEQTNMILPSDSAAAVFYITNANNRFLGNSVSGGWAGYSFPNLPKAVKLHENYKSGEFTPSSRPLKLFKGNVAHRLVFFKTKTAIRRGSKTNVQLNINAALLIGLVRLVEFSELSSEMLVC